MKFDKEHQKILDIAVGKLCEGMPNLVAVILFGSFGTEYERKDSDVDLAFLPGKFQGGIDTVTLWNLAQEIAANVGRDVELINLQKSTTVFAFQVLTTGTVIFCSDTKKLAAFDNLILSMYLRFHEERKDILNSFKEGVCNG